MSNLNPTPSGTNAVMIMSVSVCLGAYVFSYNTVILTLLAQLMRLKNDLSHEELVHELSLTTSFFMLGAFISPILYRRFVSIFGQLRGLLIIDILGIVAIATQLIQLQFYILASARFVLGLVIGISTAIIPVYINSIAPPIMVGRLGTFNQVLQTFGVFCAYLMGYLVDDHNKNDQIRWRIMLGFPVIFLILRIIILQFYYPFSTLERHITNNQVNKIEKYCLMVYGRDDSQTVQQIIQLKSFKKISQQSAGTWRRRFIIALVVIASNQFTGTNAILYYAKQLFNKITSNNSTYTQILIVLLSLLQVLSTLISTQVVDKLGRKSMILRGQAFIAVCLLGIFVFDKLLSSIFNALLGTIGVIFLIFLHIMAMNLTLGPCCIIYCAQIVQDITWIIITLKGIALLIALTTEYMIQYIGLGFMFLIFFGLTLSAHLFIRPRMVQTKGVPTAQLYAKFGINNICSIQTQPERQTLLTHPNQNIDHN